MRKIKLTDVKELYGTNVERVGIELKDKTFLFSEKVTIEGEYLIII